MELYNKYRPQTYEEMIGNEEAIKTLQVELAHGSHTFLFVGSGGCGKSTLARIAAKQVGATELTIREINSSSNNGIDTVRQIEKEVGFAPIEGNATVYILDEFHQQTSSAQNAILKVLEECPEYVYFFLCTTDPQKLIKPLITRCSQVALKPLKLDQLVKLLRKITHKERIRVDLTILEDIAQMADGSSRQALKYLSSVLYLANDEERKAWLASNAGSNENQDAIKLARTLSKGADWATICATMKEIDLTDAEGVRRMVMSYAISILSKGNLDRNAIAMLQAFSNQSTFSNGKAALWVACLDYLELLAS